MNPPIPNFQKISKANAPEPLLVKPNAVQIKSSLIGFDDNPISLPEHTRGGINKLKSLFHNFSEALVAAYDDFNLEEKDVGTFLNMLTELRKVEGMATDVLRIPHIQPKK